MQLTAGALVPRGVVVAPQARASSSAEASCSGRPAPGAAFVLRRGVGAAAPGPAAWAGGARALPGGLGRQGRGLRAGMAFCGTDSLERGREQAGDFSAHISVPTTAMAKLGGSGGAVTIERTKLNLSQKVQTAEPKLSNDGGGGGIGNKIFNGGGGDGDDGDDDDYFNFEGDDGDGDDGFWRTAVKELYDEASISAVLAEWFRTFTDLPAIIRQSVQLGLFSSAQLVRFLSMDVRPNITRRVTRTLPPKVARGIVGRLMADPAFMQKLVIEQLITAGLSLSYEAQQRGDRFMQELDFVALNTASLMASTGLTLWLVAPSRSYGAVHKFPWQNALHNLPNHVFDASTPYRRFSLASRVGALFAKAGELCAVGSLTGAAQSLGGRGLVSLRRLRQPDFEPSLQVPELRRSSGGLAAYMGTVANLRYQAVGGLDRLMFDRMGVMLVYVACSSVLRTLSQCFGHSSRLFAQGLPLRAPPRAPRLPAPAATRKVVRRRVKRKASAAPAPTEDLELSAQYLAYQQQLQRRRQQQLGAA